MDYKLSKIVKAIKKDTWGYVVTGNLFDFYISDLKVRAISVIKRKRTIFHIVYKENVYEIGTSRQVFDLNNLKESRMIDSFLRMIKKKYYDWNTIRKILNETICTRDDNWVKHHGL